MRALVGDTDVVSYICKKDTRASKYSKEFLKRLSEDQRKLLRKGNGAK